MRIEIRKSEVFSEVEKQTAYIAASLDDGIHFDELWATVHDHALMNSYWVEGCASAVSLLMRYIRNETAEHNLNNLREDETLTFRTDMPDTFNDFLTGSIVTSLKMMMVNGILGAWLNVKYPAAAEYYRQLSKDYSEDVRTKLLHRVLPFQNRSEHKGEDTLNETVAEQFAEAGADAADKPVTDYYETRETDNVILKQYEKCCHYPEKR